MTVQKDGKPSVSQGASRSVDAKPYFPDFPKSEYEHRYARAREMMGEAKLDALLVTENLNYIYFTGHRSQQSVIDKVRPYIFVLPKDDEGVVITAPFEFEQIAATTWITDVRHGKLSGFVADIADALHDKGLGSARIGAELGRGQYLGMSYNEFEDLKGMLPAKFVDASNIYRDLRAVKSSLEVDYLRKAAVITSRAIDRTFETIRADMTELDVMRTLRIRLAEEGAENVTFMWIVNSKVGMVAPATDKPLTQGGLLVLDLGVEYRGYTSDIARAAVVGQPNSEIAEFYQWFLDVRRECVADFLRPGLTPKEVVPGCRERFAKKGVNTLHTNRVGHSVGLESSEPPGIGIGVGQYWPGEEDTVFKPGMVMAWNPTFTPSFGWFNVEDEWLITETDPDLLSTPPPDKVPLIRE